MSTPNNHNKRLVRFVEISGEFYSEKNKVERLIDELLTSMDKRACEIKEFCKASKDKNET